MTTLPALHTVEEAAGRLQMGRSTLYRLVKLGQVPYTVLENGKVRLSDQDIRDIRTARERAMLPARVHRPAEAA